MPAVMAMRVVTAPPVKALVLRREDTARPQRRMVRAVAITPWESVRRSLTGTAEPQRRVVRGVAIAAARQERA
jgi:hypothetical protein